MYMEQLQNATKRKYILQYLLAGFDNVRSYWAYQSSQDVHGEVRLS